MAGLLGPLIGVSSVPLLGPLLGDAPTSTSAVAEPTVAPQPTETGAGVVVVPVPTVSAQPPSAPLPTTNIPTLSTSVVNATPTQSQFLTTPLPSTIASIPTATPTSEPAGPGGIPILIPVLAVALGVVAIAGIIGVALVTRRRRNKWPFNGRRRSRSFAQLNDLEYDSSSKKAALDARWDPSFR